MKGMKVMNEVTRIFTASITKVYKGTKNMKTKEEAADSMKNILKMGLDVDDVVIEEVQDFEMECTDLYTKGLNDAWELARKLALNTYDGGIDSDEVRSIFGVSPYDVFAKYEPQEAIERLAAYEKEQGKGV